MLERLDFWLAIFTLGALAYFELRLGRFIGPIVRGIVSVAEPAAKEIKRRSSRQLPTTVRLKPRPVRGDRGQFNGSLPAVPEVPISGSRAEHGSVDSSASERAGTMVPDVPLGTISAEEAALIGLRLGRGMSPSAVAKSLPGYSARRYRDYMAKVANIEAALADYEPTEEAPTVK